MKECWINVMWNGEYGREWASRGQAETARLCNFVRTAYRLHVRLKNKEAA